MELTEKEVFSETVPLLLADPGFLNPVLRTFRIGGLEIIEQATSPAHHHEKATAGCVVFNMRLEVLCQLTDPLAQDGNLDFGAAGVLVVRPVSGNDVGLLFSR